MKILAFIFILFVAGCAQVGPVDIGEDDTVWTVGIAFGVAASFWFAKCGIEHFFAKRLEKYKKDLENDK